MAASSLSAGALAYQQRLTAAEVEFLAEECLVAIIPKFQVDFFQFIEVWLASFVFALTVADTGSIRQKLVRLSLAGR